MSSDTRARNILNGLKWRHDRVLDQAEIYYIHRGAPHNTRIITGGMIKNIGRSFIELEDAFIPYHRIFRITYHDRILYEHITETG